MLCPICSIPGHLPCVHQATDFRQRKLVIDTFGWLAFKEWFQVGPENSFYEKRKIVDRSGIKRE